MQIIILSFLFAGNSWGLSTSGTSGLTLTCASGEYVNSSVTKNGIVSSGTCATASSSVAVSTWVITPAFTVTATAVGVCNSTITMTTGNSYVDVILSAVAGNSVQDGSACGFLIDGAYIDGFSSLITPGFCIAQGAADMPCNIGFNWTSKAKISAGSHSFCLTCATAGSGTTTIGTTWSGQTALNQFKAVERP